MVVDIGYVVSVLKRFQYINSFDVTDIVFAVGDEFKQFHSDAEIEYTGLNIFHLVKYYGDNLIDADPIGTVVIPIDEITAISKFFEKLNSLNLLETTYLLDFEPFHIEQSEILEWNKIGLSNKSFFERYIGEF